MSRPRASALLLPLILVIVAGGLRLANLDEPSRIIFDETYYVNDARAYLDTGVEEGFAVHPPVGKWLIAAGIALFGDDSFGWRVSGAIAGTLVVLFTYLIGARLLRWRGAAALAALLAAVDGLLFVQARTAMLDVFLGLFVALGAWLLLVDHDRNRLDEPGARDAADRDAQQLTLPGVVDDEPPVADPAHAGWRPTDVPPRGHGIRILAGVVFGLAIATKWSGLLALAAAGLLVLGWELVWRRRLTGRATRGVLLLAAQLFVAFALVPTVVYIASYVPWFVNYGYTTEGEDECADDPANCHVSLIGRIDGFIDYQVAIANFHRDLDATHPYRAPASTWPILGRPVVYYWENCTPERASGVATTNSEGEVEEPEPCVVSQGNAAEIIALGNPALWWIGLAALLPLAIGAIRLDRRAWYLVAFLGTQYVPWLAVNRPAFFFYMTPAVPFLALTVAYATTTLDEAWEWWADRRGKPLRATRITPTTVTATIVALAAVIAFVYFYPVYAGIQMDYDLIRQRWWFDSWI